MNALRSTIRLSSRTLAQRAQKRQMGSGAQVQWTGIDKVIRDRFPEDYQGKCAGKRVRVIGRVSFEKFFYFIST